MEVRLDGRKFKWMELGPEKPLCKVGLYEWKEGIPRKYPVHTGITLEVSDVQEFHNRLKTKGTKFITPPKHEEWEDGQQNSLIPTATFSV